MDTALATPEVVAIALRYPTEERLRTLTIAIEALERGNAEREMRRFAKGIDGQSLHDIEEMFTTTFDLSPLVAPYVGHLAWGDSYERGSFMAELRGAMRDVGVDPEGELPDHLDPILRYLAATDEPVESLAPVLVPAITKMEKTLKKADSKNPYIHVLQAARLAAEERLR
ncbi:MAG: nitrate reductase [Proteobacteria bacterium]|nr:nitrate reductase [Pseudomonadota bacterium]